MQRFYFYLIYPLIYLIALLPFWVYYRVSDFFYSILRLTGYLQRVVIKNLQNSFPAKNEKEIQVIGRCYYRYLCDLTLETLKTLKMTKKETQSRCIFHQQVWLTKLYEEHQSIIIIMGHYGNWEWAGPSFSLNTPYQLVEIRRASCREKV